MRTIFTIDWQKPGRRVLLASRSPRRSDLLRRMGFSFDVVAPDVDDELAFLDKDDIRGSLQRLAREKTKGAAARHPDALVLGADTIVVCGGSILGKPRGAADARAMLNRLKGRRHFVYSAVALACGEDGFFKSRVEKTRVFFRDIDSLKNLLTTVSGCCSLQADPEDPGRHRLDLNRLV